jgi:hypothetical protein
MGCQFCLPGDKNEIRTLEAEPILVNFEISTIQRNTQRLYTVREEGLETSENSDVKNNIT